MGYTRIEPVACVKSNVNKSFFGLELFLQKIFGIHNDLLDFELAFGHKEVGNHSLTCDSC